MHSEIATPPREKAAAASNHRAGRQRVWPRRTAEDVGAPDLLVRISGAAPDFPLRNSRYIKYSLPSVIHYDIPEQVGLMSEIGQVEPVAREMEVDPESLVPLPRLAFQILLALARGEGHGYAIAKEVERNTDGRTKPSTGSLYLSMDKLHSQALIEETGGPANDARDDARRRYFRITPLGRRVARAETERMLRLVNLARERDLLGEGPGLVPSGEAEAGG